MDGVIWVMRYYFSFSLTLMIALMSCGGDEGAPGSNPDNITFITQPSAQVGHTSVFSFQPQATHKNGDALTFKIEAPAWLNYDKSENKVSGTPDWDRLNSSFRVKIMATNGIDTAIQRTDIQVTLGEIVCGTNFGDPADSEYILPFEPRQTYKLQNGNCPTNPNWGHQRTFAYDFGTPMGTNILAMRGGTVIASISHQPDVPDCSVGGGNIVFIQHSDGSVAFYGHFKQNSVMVEVGDRVNQGQLLAQSGNSGCSAGPHVHVQVYRQAGPYDRQYSLPINFSNSDGPLNSQGSLVIGENYTAL